jgi:hypothetical protein
MRYRQCVIEIGSGMQVSSESTRRGEGGAKGVDQGGKGRGRPKRACCLNPEATEQEQAGALSNRGRARMSGRRPDGRFCRTPGAWRASGAERVFLVGWWGRAGRAGGGGVFGGVAVARLSGWQYSVREGAVWEAGGRRGAGGAGGEGAVGMEAIIHGAVGNERKDKRLAEQWTRAAASAMGEQ